MKIVIIEDEPQAAIGLQTMLAGLDQSIEVIAILESVAQAVTFLSSPPLIDVVFSDIQLEDGLSFEIFEKVKVKVPIIFTTAYNQYAIQAFQTNGIGYLLKPIDKQLLSQTLQKYKELTPDIAIDKLVHMAASIQQSKSYKSRFLVKAGDKIKTVLINEVLAFFSQEKTTYLFTVAEKKHITDHSLDQLEGILDPGLFFRINRKTILHIDACIDLQSWSSSRIKVNIDGFGKIDTVVSRDRYRSFRNWLDR